MNTNSEKYQENLDAETSIHMLIINHKYMTFKQNIAQAS